MRIDLQGLQMLWDTVSHYDNNVGLESIGGKDQEGNGGLFNGGLVNGGLISVFDNVSGVTTNNRNCNDSSQTTDTDQSIAAKVQALERMDD